MTVTVGLLDAGYTRLKDRIDAMGLDIEIRAFDEDGNFDIGGAKVPAADAEIDYLWLGPDLAGVIDPVIFGNVQNTLLAGHLTGAPLPVSTTLASLPVVFALCLSDERHRMVGELVQGLLAPYVAVTMGYRSWPNPQCWRLFVLALISMLAVFAFQAVEPRLCGLPGAVLWHSVVIHLVIVSTFGSVAFLGLRLLKVDTEHKKAE